MSLATVSHQNQGAEEHGLLQMIIRMIQPPPCSCIPLQMVICKEDGSPDDQNQGNGGARIVANDQPEDPASSVPLQMVFCKEDCASDDQNQRDGGARVVVNNHLDDPASSVPLRSFANGLLQRERSSGGPTFFWSDGRMKFAPDLSLV